MGPDDEYPEGYDDEDEADFDIPATCLRCGQLFPSGIGLGLGASAYVQNAMAAGCPRCGGVGRVSDGMWQAVREITNVARALDTQTLSDLVTLLEAERAQPEVSRERAAQRVQARTPYAHALVSFLGNPAVQGGAAVMSLLISILTLALQMRAPAPPPAGPVPPQPTSSRSDGQPVVDHQEEPHQEDVGTQEDSRAHPLDEEQGGEGHDQSEPESGSRSAQGPHGSHDVSSAPE